MDMHPAGDLSLVRGRDLMAGVRTFTNPHLGGIRTGKL